MRAPMMKSRWALRHYAPDGMLIGEHPYRTMRRAAYVLALYHQTFLRVPSDGYVVRLERA